MEPVKPKSKQALTPGKIMSSRQGFNSSNNTKSQKIIPKHRPSYSCNDLVSSAKKLSISKDLVSNPKIKTQTKPKDTPKKLIVHKKSSSTSEKTSKSVPKTIETTHRSIHAKEKSKVINVISKYAYRSNTGYMPGNPDKVNQDIFIIKLNLNFNYSLFSIADGHGINGEHVSNYIKTKYPALISNNPFLLSNPYKAIVSSASKLNKQVLKQDFDTNFSGSTFISILIRGKKLWCGNIGDSRALLGRQVLDNADVKKNLSNRWMSIALSRDHKPNEADESGRIIANGGRVEAYQDEHGNPFGPSRVWLQKQQIPGLAMSRSIGDRVASSVGVISEPEVLEFDLTPDDKFIVLGSDGIFEFLTNEDVIKLVVPYWRRKDCEGAAEVLAKEAKLSWQRVTIT
jgi:serine/threonine protein phosphatase PrpC